MAQLDSLPYNLIKIINKLLENDNLIKLVNDNSSNPLTSVMPAKRADLYFKRIFPFPTSPAIETIQSQIRIYYPDTVIESGRAIENTIIHFDIVVHNDLMQMFDLSNKRTFRPDEIAKEIIKQFEQSVDTVGKLNFYRRVHLVVNPDFQMIRLFAKMMTIA